MKRFLPALILYTVLWLNPGYMQDMTMSPWIWEDAGDPPDELPIIASFEVPAVPKEMKKFEGYAYALVTITVQPDNKLSSFWVEGTHPYLRKELFSEMPDKLRAAKRAGKKVAGKVRTAVIFNPRSAPAEGETVRPRLLQVTPVVIETAEKLKYPDILPVQLQISATGKVTGVQMPAEVPAPLAERVRTTVEAWQVAPAREQGQAVTAEIEVPVVIYVIKPPKAGQRQEPVAKYKEPPVYPWKQRFSGFKGNVLVEFTVDTEGRVQRPFVRQSNNPGFDAAAIEAVRKWTFTPATENGRPVESKRMQVLIIFQLQDGSGASAFKVTYSKREVAKLPPEFRYDVPPKLLNVMPAVYPYTALIDRAKGKVDVAFVVDPSGRVMQMKIWSTDRPDFAEAVKAMVDTLQFTPALNEGKPTMSIMRMVVKFDEEFGDVSLDASTSALLKDIRRNKLSLAGVKELDGKMKPVSTRSPVFPLEAKADTGTALIEFLVDEAGLAQLPRIVEASAPEFGYAACQAVATWRFEPPLKGGKPVNVRVQVPVNFNRK